MKYCENYQNMTQRHEVKKCCWKKGVQHRVVTNFQSIKKTQYLQSTITCSTIKPGMLVFSRKEIALAARGERWRWFSLSSPQKQNLAQACKPCITSSELQNSPLKSHIIIHAFQIRNLYSKRLSHLFHIVQQFF